MTITPRVVLKTNRLFRDLPDAALDRLAGLAVRRSVRRGARIFAEGDPGDSLLGIVAGQVRISATTPGGKEAFLNIMEPGESFGEIAVLDGGPRTANAEALMDTELFLIRRVDLLALVESEPKLAGHLIELLCKRLRWTSALVEDSAFLSAERRLARRVLTLAREHGTSGPDGVTLRINQAGLAGFMGASRQVVNQHLQEWRRRGWLQLGRGRLTITSEQGLRSVLDQPG
jgi:CRP-like cAMP-binding protein